MKKIGFIGAYDKIDLVMYVGKILTVIGKKVLIVDATKVQKARYVVPVINPTIRYITEFEEMDIAIGFNGFEEIKKYFALSDEQEIQEYDYILIDADDSKGFENYNLEDAQKNYFITSFDVYSLKKGLDAFYEAKKTVNLTKVLFSKTVDKEEDDYLNFLSLGYKIIWSEQRIYFPFESGDLSVINENQRVAKIKFKKLSVPYKDGLSYLAEEILGDTSSSKIRKAIKTIEKGG